MSPRARRPRMPRATVTIIVATLAVVLGGEPAAVRGQSPAGEYKIGVLEPLTGPLAFEGKRHLEGLEIVRDLINERGGVMGKKLAFAVADATDPTAAASEANRLIAREGVKIITGTFSSRLCGAASEVAARHNVIYWESSCVDPRFNKRGLKHVYRTEIDASGFGWYNVEFIAKHLAPRLNLKPNQLKIAFLSEDSSYGQGVTESARQRAKQEFGMQELMLEYYNWTTLNDMTPTILKLKQLKPDVVHHIGIELLHLEDRRRHVVERRPVVVLEHQLLHAELLLRPLPGRLRHALAVGGVLGQEGDLELVGLQIEPGGQVLGDELDVVPAEAAGVDLGSVDVLE